MEACHPLTNQNSHYPLGSVEEIEQSVNTKSGEGGCGVAKSIPTMIYFLYPLEMERVQNSLYKTKQNKTQ